MSLTAYREKSRTPEPRSGKRSGKRSLDFTRPADPPEHFPDPPPRPMLAKLVRDVMDNPDWIYEMKLDGYRMICSIRDGRVSMMSRNGKSFNQSYPVLLNDLGKIEESVILDGEMIVENSRGISDFQLLQNYSTTRKGKLKYIVFDILYLNGHSVMNFPLLKRKELLDTFFCKYKFKNVFNLEYQTGNGRQLYDLLSAKGYEGIIAKEPDSVYAPGKRGETWLKVKAHQMQEAVICGYTAPQGSRKYFGSIILGLYENGILKYVGNCGTGFNETSLKELHEKFSTLKTDECPFPVRPKLSYAKGKPFWLKPELVANIKFFEWSRDEIMRAPVFMGLRIDKKATEAVNEMKSTEETAIAEKSGAEEKSRKRAGTSRIKSELTANDLFSQGENEKTVTSGGKMVKCTNLRKVYWPGEGYTKGDLISYYYRISKFILPYLKDRPQSLNRHPNGIKGPNFYQKDMDVDQIPGWLKTVSLYSKSNDENIDYLICNDTATLIYMANLGCIEINPWHSTYKKPDEPTYMMLDLDPGDISFVDVVNTALVIKELCDEIQIPCYCKTSGATGLHIYIPLGARYDYDQAKTFAEILAGIAHRRLPSTTSTERVVSKRKDKIYIDFLQNRKAQTIAAPYSVRPKPFATVSTPLKWEEVNHQLTPEMFTISNIEQRLAITGDLWQPVLKTGISLVKALKAIEKLS